MLLFDDAKRLGDDGVWIPVTAGVHEPLDDLLLLRRKRYLHGIPPNSISMAFQG